MDKLIIIDANAIIHRAFHALPNFKSKKGEDTGALYGFILSFLKVVEEQNPNYIVSAFDMKGPTFRHKRYKEYKGKRKKAPDELYSQIPKVKEFLKKAGVLILEKKGYEADDIIGTISSKEKKETLIVTGDLDLLQLATEKTKILIMDKGIKKGTLYDVAKVKERFSGISPSMLVDYKALRGDPSDNIPGVIGIGEKKATELIKEYKTIENIYNKMKKEDILYKKIMEGKEIAFLSKELSRIEKNVPISFNLKRWSIKERKKEILQFLNKYNFKSLSLRFSEKKNMTLF